MDQREAIIEVGRRIAPIMQEFGIESCVLMGYVRIDEKLERFLAVDIKKDDHAQADGLRQAAMFGMMWAAPQPPAPEKSPDE